MLMTGRIMLMDPNVPYAELGLDVDALFIDDDETDVNALSQIDAQTPAPPRSGDDTHDAR
jgi:hypothetical protein